MATAIKNSKHGMETVRRRSMYVTEASAATHEFNVENVISESYALLDRTNKTISIVTRTLLPGRERPTGIGILPNDSNAQIKEAHSKSFLPSLKGCSNIHRTE